MSARRFFSAVAIVFVAIVCAPAAQAPGINSADLICVFAPIALVAVLMRRRPQTPVEAPSRLPHGIPSRGLDGTNDVTGSDR